MRAFLAVLALLLPLSACSVRSAPTSSGPAAAYRPLRARIIPPGLGQLSFQTNRPAYVAMFEIVPGGGASLVYPYLGSGSRSGYTFSGIHTVGTRSYAGRDLYRASFTRFASSGPRFFFLIASEQPLQLAEIGAFGRGLHSALGTAYTSLNAYDTMDELTAMLVPNAYNAGGWTTDSYVYWPEVVADRSTWGYVPVSCNGRSTYVRAEYFWAVYDMLCDRQPEADRPLRLDSAGVDIPERRRPDPEELEPRDGRPEAREENQSRPAEDRWSGPPPRREPRSRERPRIEVPRKPRVEPRSEPTTRVRPRPAPSRPRVKPRPVSRPRPSSSSEGRDGGTVR